MSGSPSVSAYVPCFNDAATIRGAVESLLNQTVSPAEVLVIDDGSSDRPSERLRGLEVRIVRHGSNLGRGAARATAMAEAKHDIVVCCDAANVLEPAFIEKALPWMAEPDIAAVFGSIAQRPAKTVAERWRGRHLFRLDVPQQVRRHASFATTGAMVRASALRQVGGYDRALRQCEDAELGDRLLRAGFDVVFDPGLTITAIAANNATEVLERYWRWGVGIDEALTWRWYVKQIAYSIKVMARQDLAAGDVWSVPLSLFSPHYQFWRTFGRRMKRRFRLDVAPLVR